MGGKENWCCFKTALSILYVLPLGHTHALSQTSFFFLVEGTWKTLFSQEYRLFILISELRNLTGRTSKLLEEVLPWLLIVGMGVAWGLSFSLAKIAVNYGALPMGAIFWQSILSGLFLLVISALFKKRLWQGLKFLGLCAFIAVCGYIIPGIIYYYAAVHVQAGILSITITLVPLLTYGFSIPLRLEKPTFKRMTGLILGTAAILLIVIPQGSLPDPSDIPWILLACLSSAFYST